MGQARCQIPLQHLQVRLAFLADEANPAIPATLESVDGDRVSLRWLDGSTLLGDQVAGTTGYDR